MKRNWTFRGLKFAVFVLVAVPLFGLVIMSVWNWSMPAVFGLRAVTFWQALDLFILSRILFGTFRGFPHFGGMYARQRILERMTPEERERFRGGMRNACGFVEKDSVPPSPGTGA